MTTDPNCCGGRHGRPCGGNVIEEPPEQPHLAAEIRWQRRMVADLIVGNAENPPRKGEFGPLWPCGTDAATGKPYNLGELFDHYARAMLCVAEVMERAS